MSDDRRQERAQKTVAACRGLVAEEAAPRISDAEPNDPALTIHGAVAELRRGAGKPGTGL